MCCVRDDVLMMKNDVTIDILFTIWKNLTVQKSFSMIAILKIFFKRVQKIMYGIKLRKTLRKKSYYIDFKK